MDFSYSLQTACLWVALPTSDQAHQGSGFGNQNSGPQGPHPGWRRSRVVFTAIEQVDSSSGAIATAVNNAIETLVPIIEKAPANDNLRDQWLERLWRAVEDDDIPYIELLPDHWGTLCVTPERASRWADDFIDLVRTAWGPNPEMRGYYKGTGACLSALLKAGRYTEILALIELGPHKFWHDRKWGMKALLAMGKKAEALRFAEASRELNEPDLF